MAYEALRLSTRTPFAGYSPERRAQLEAVAAEVAERRRLGINRATPLPSATGAAKAQAPSKRQASTSTSPALFTQADLNAAAGKARSGERNRWAAVFASPAAKGRERVCATLLASPKNFTAAAIIAELPHLPTDWDRATNVSHASTDAVWGKAYSGSKAAQIVAAQRAMGSPHVKPAANKGASDAVWAKAYDATPVLGGGN